MKIGIMTFWWADNNYGQLLQCYALQKHLQNLGHDAYVIQYKESAPINRGIKATLKKLVNPLKVFKFLKNKINEKIIQKEETINPRFFNSFREKHIKFSKQYYTSYQELLNSPPEAEIYIVGSDQVWNFYSSSAKNVPNEINAYLLNFGSKNTKKISYAASFGKIHLEKTTINKLSPLLSQFSKISVREKTAMDICKTCGINHVTWVCDPTLLLTMHNYEQLMKEVQETRKPQNPYIFFYYLDNGGAFNKESLYKWAKNKNLDIVYISANSSVDSYPKFYATIPEWLYLIKNATYVLTNSFHGCVFSTIFHKNFLAIPLTGKYKSMNSRLESLFSIVNIKKRYLEKYNYDLFLTPPNYEAKKDTSTHQKLFEDFLFNE